MDPRGTYGRATRAAVEAFQRHRGLRVDGVCGPQTWRTLVEAGFRLGDRTLFRRTPSLRGDDVAELQQRLSALGFDAGRVDGIFGDATANALREFQENAALPVDGIVGAATLRAIRRVERTDHATQDLVSTVRARERLRHSPRTLAGRHVGVGEPGGLAALVSTTARRLSAAGARVTTLHHPDDEAQAHQANAAGVDVYLVLRLEPARPGCQSAYYAGYRDDDPVGGRLLAEAVQRSVPSALGLPDLGARGMSLTVLRESRMTTVVVEIGPAAAAVERARDLADAFATALTAWAAGPWE